MICLFVCCSIFMTGCAQTQSRNGNLVQPFSAVENSVVEKSNSVDDEADQEPAEAEPVLTRFRESAKETAKEAAEGAVFNVMFLVVMPVVFVAALPVVLVRLIVDRNSEE
jgi:hypothetical protein